MSNIDEGVCGGVSHSPKVCKDESLVVVDTEEATEEATEDVAEDAAEDVTEEESVE